MSPSSSSTSSPTGEGEAGAAAVVVASDVYADHEAFAADLQAVRTAYYAQARGPSVHKALSAFLVEAMPTALRAINQARAAESDRRCADLTQRVASLEHDLEVVGSRVGIFEAQCADLRRQRQQGALEKARAEQESRIAKEEMGRLQERIAELESELEGAQDKLKAERLAHAQTRVQLKAAGGGVGGEASTTIPPSTPLPPGKRSLSASVSSVAVTGLQTDAAGVAASGVDMRAITGIDADVVRDAEGNDIVSAADVTRMEEEVRAQLRMRPTGMGAPQGIVEFPEAPQGGACGGGKCVIQ